MIGKLFGKKKKESSSGGSQDKEKALKTIQDLDNQIKTMEEKSQFYEKKMNGLVQEAKNKLKAGDKNGAKNCLAKKKRIQTQLKQIDGAMAMMEEQKMMLESADHMKDVFKTISSTNKVIKEVGQGMNVEDMEKVREEMEDLKDTQNEMTDFFENYNQDANEDLEDELGELEKEMKEQEAEDLPKANTGEIVQPSQPVPAEKNSEEKELEDFLA